MRATRSGSSLAELMAMGVLTAIVLSAVYQTLLVQERAYAAGGIRVEGQASVRSALEILETDLRQAGSIGGGRLGGTDFAVASRDSVVFRAQRKVGFVCGRGAEGHTLLTWSLGVPFEPGDSLLLFVDGDPHRGRDAGWRSAVTRSVSEAPADAECRQRWPERPVQQVEIAGPDLAGIPEGAPVRAFEWVSYGLHAFGPREWGLARRSGKAEPRHLVGGLAPPGDGLRFQFFTPEGRETTDPRRIARMRITVETDTGRDGGIGPTALTTNLYLRNN